MKRKKFASVAEMARDALGADSSITKELDAELSATRIVRMLFALRSARGITQAAIAKQLNCTQSRVSKIEAGVDADLRIGEIEGYARALGCNLQLAFVNRIANGTDRVKHHALAIKRELDGLAGLVHDDPQLHKGVAEFFNEAFVNLLLIVAGSAQSLPDLTDGNEVLEVSAETDDRPFSRETLSRRIPAGCAK